MLVARSGMGLSLLKPLKKSETMSNFSEQTQSASLAPLAPIAGVVFVAFFVIGLALPVLPLHVHDNLGMSAFVVGLVAGCQFAAALVSRLWAGRITDTRGPKQAVVLGLVAAIAGGACYLLSLKFLPAPKLSVGVLLLGRTLVGGAESLIVTGGMLWGLGRVAAERSAQVIAWVGMSMFAAIALGSPIGSLVFERFGFFGIALASTLVPLVSLACIAPVRALAPVASAEVPMSAVLGAVLLPGIGFALSGITFGAATVFLTLYFSVQGWAGGALAFTFYDFRGRADRHANRRWALAGQVRRRQSLTLLPRGPGAGPCRHRLGPCGMGCHLGSGNRGSRFLARLPWSRS